MDNENDELERYFTGYEILPRYDVIRFQFYLYTDSFVFRRYEHEGYKLLKHRKKYAPSDKPYYPTWEIDKFQNLQTGNPIIYMMSDKMRDNHLRPMFMVRIDFHGEKSPLTAEEINQFLALVISRYQEFISAPNTSCPDSRALIIPKPYASKIEIALDFRGANVTFLHEHMCSNLYKLRSRKRTTIPDEDENEVQDSKQTKPIYTFDGRVLYGIFPSHYISDCYRDYLYDDKEGNEVFRCEMILTKSYLLRNKIVNTDDIERFDKTKYWTDNYFFFKIDRDRVISYVRRERPELVQDIERLLDAGAILTPFQIYEKLKTYTIEEIIEGRRVERRLFGYLSRFLKSKWKTFDGMIQNALVRLTLSGKPIEREFTPTERKRDKAPAKRGRKSREQDIIKAFESLTKKGLKVTYEAIEKEADITPKTIAKYKDLLNIMKVIECLKKKRLRVTDKALAKEGIKEETIAKYRDLLKW